MTGPGCWGDLFWWDARPCGADVWIAINKRFHCITVSEPRSGLGLPFILTGLFLDKVEPLRKFIMRKGNLVTKIGGVILILIGVLQVSNFWDTLMNSMRDLISGFIPIL